MPDTTHPDPESPVLRRLASAAQRFSYQFQHRAYHRHEWPAALDELIELANQYQGEIEPEPTEEALQEAAPAGRHE